MFTNLFRSLRRRTLCRRILTAHPGMAALTGDELIDCYVERRIRDHAQELVRFRASIHDPDAFGGQLQYPAPMDALFRRALLHVGTNAKVDYIRQTYLLAGEVVELEARLADCQERNQQHLELERAALDLATQYNEEIMALERSQRVDSLVRSN